MHDAFASEYMWARRGWRLSSRRSIRPLMWRARRQTRCREREQHQLGARRDPALLRELHLRLGVSDMVSTSRSYRYLPKFATAQLTLSMKRLRRPHAA